MMHRTHTDFGSHRGIQPLPEPKPRWPLYRCPCFYTESFTGRIVCAVCQQPANIEVRP